MNLRDGWAEDGEDVWYTAPHGRRQRGRWATCQGCQERFPSLPSNRGLYCSRSCQTRASGGSNRATRLDLFEQWTPEECWLAGLLWADGHYGSDRGTPRVQINLTDEDAVAAVALITGAAYHTHQQGPRDGYARKPIHRLSFGERGAVKRLFDVGFGEWPLGWPTLPHPTSFLRGAFDGDGSVVWCQQGGRRKTATAPLRLHTSLCGTVPFLEGAQRLLAEHGVAPKTISRHAGIWRVQWNHADSLRLAAVMYSEPGPCMARKRDTWG